MARVTLIGVFSVITAAAAFAAAGPAQARASTPAPVPARVAAPSGQAPARDATSAGQAAFDRVCKVCHGPEARGDAGPRLVPFSREYEELLGIVREGTGQMPPISARELSDESVADIVKYLTSLSR